MTSPAWFLLTGIGGGLAGSVTGVASLVAYPSLLALGLDPVSANVTATVANVFGGVGSSVGSRPELTGQRRRVTRLAAVAATTGLAGAGVLLATPTAVFARIVPVLIGLGSLAILRRTTPVERPDRPGDRRDPRSLTAVTGAVALYCGYFGAAAGVLMLAALLGLTGESLPRATGAKNVAMMAANASAAVVFAAAGPVRWAAVAPLAAGYLIGGRLGPIVVRRVPAGPLRAVIAACGVGLAVHLALGAYR